jgi:CBS domain-containing protein
MLLLKDNKVGEREGLTCPTHTPGPNCDLGVERSRSPGEMADARAQLPDEYNPLFEWGSEGEIDTPPVVDDGRFVGLVALEDVRGVSRDAWDTTTVHEIMTPVAQLVVVPPDEDAAEALNKLTQRDVRQLPVVRDGDLAGLLRRRDIIKWLQLESELNIG